MGNEELYDAEIATRLRDVASLCERNGMTMTALVEWSSHDSGLTTVGKPLGACGLLTRYAASAHGNLDAMLLAVLRERGTCNSFVLRMLNELGDRARGKEAKP